APVPTAGGDDHRQHREESQGSAPSSHFVFLLFLIRPSREGPPGPTTRKLDRPMMKNPTIEWASDVVGRETDFRLPSSDSVGEWPTLPVVADPQPDPIQTERLEDQEDDDEGAVDDE